MNRAPPSASWMKRPLAIFSPVLRAADSPLCRCRMYTIPSASSSISFSGVMSEPSSTTIISRSSRLSERVVMLSMHSRSSVVSVLQTVMMKLISGCVFIR